MLVLALCLVGCGSQIPFGTPGVGGGPVPATVAPGTSSAPSAGTASPARSGGPAPSTSAGASVPPASLGPAAPVYTVAAVDLKITLPVGWVGFDSTTSQAAVSEAIAEHPELEEALSLLQSGLAFVAVDAAATGAGQPASMTVSSTGSAIPSQALLESLAQTTAAQIEATQPIDGTVTQTTIDLPAGPAVNLVWQLQQEDGAEPLGLDAYLLSVGERTFAVTFAAPLSVRDGFQPAFRGIVESMAPA